jgi:hypothetical protein
MQFPNPEPAKLPGVTTEEKLGVDGTVGPALSVWKVSHLIKHLFEDTQGMAFHVGDVDPTLH